MSPAAEIAVRVTPRSSRDAIEGVDDAGQLRVRVTAPPADGVANTAVIKLLAKELGVPKGAVNVAAGTTSRHKRMRIDGVAVAELRQRWPSLSVKQR